MSNSVINFKEHIRVIEDFPTPGISFKDITTLMKDGEVYKAAIAELRKLVEHYQIDLVAGPEARGFVIGCPLALELGVGFVPVRKNGKLPGETIGASYALEYGSDQLAMHKDAIKPGQRVLIADDLLATGGTIATVVDLIKQLGGEVVGAAFLIELEELQGRKKFDNIDVHALVTYPV